ncbi:hypothetical protein SERLADRAFT_469085 [Serpula lacrymans var. lacrymans S7.9]|uniref:Major facilitator superfamily (MFS) profile domain-containing protein n=1 Tax=Serpula lacrymans var. lacrymans (strain S7.9) TaxID=578457 RepID=F8NWK5_SERL9|nr:uncharacterized protein SERLADRAFT_469085 [Serpula lacrymans var. lacrymans S7.9]EGO25030.1 hypothetical protein SERLADRAFT_469085 [Serpula lacrymans var. lacrymans S7.9]
MISRRPHIHSRVWFIYLILNSAPKKCFRDTASQRRNARPLAFCVSICYMCYGWNFGSMDGIFALLSFQQHFEVDDMSMRAGFDGTFVSVYIAGSFLWSLTASCFSSWFAIALPFGSHPFNS